MMVPSTASCRSSVIACTSLIVIAHLSICLPHWFSNIQVNYLVVVHLCHQQLTWYLIFIIIIIITIIITIVIVMILQLLSFVAIKIFCILTMH
jgi:hypothetical protein